MTHLVTVERAFDSRQIPAAQRAAEVLSQFDLLSPGDRFVLVSPDSGREVLRRLQTERPGLFEWSPLSTGQSVWRMEIARREASAGARRKVSEALSWDHDRLDALEAAAFRARVGSDLQSAYDLYAEFAIGLRRHIGFEEQIVFPVFEDRSGVPASVGPTAMMRMEHREIRDLLDQIESGIGDPAAPVEDLRRAFGVLMEEHNLKEERVLYPAIDRELGEEEADRVVREVQRYGA